MFKNLISAFLEPINLIFTLVMLALFVFDIIKYKKRDSSIPGIISAIGMLGTFFGIFIGLMDFNQNNIEASVPMLLVGMKTAFITSITGMILSNILKFFKIKSTKEQDTKTGANNNSTESDNRILARYMKDVKDSIVASNQSFEKSIKESREDQKQIFTKMALSLVGDSESSLTSQMKLLRKEMLSTQNAAQERINQGLNAMSGYLGKLVTANNAIGEKIAQGNDQLINEFRAFAKQMAENNMEAFTDAIQKCIKDLNNQLQTQFGDNFKELNQAVIKLLQWQENYKQTIEYTTALQKNIFSSISQVNESLKAVAGSSENIVGISDRLNGQVNMLDTREQALSNTLLAMNKVSDDAQMFIPKMNSYIEKVNTTLNEVCNGLYKMSRSASENIKAQQDQMILSIKGLSKEVIGSNEANIMSIKKQIETISQASSKLENDSLFLTKSVSDNIRQMVEENNANLQESVKELNTQLASTLNMSLESLGNQLATVSEKFVKDYIPLTEQLKRLVEIVKR